MSRFLFSFPISVRLLSSLYSQYDTHFLLSPCSTQSSLECSFIITHPLSKGRLCFRPKDVPFSRSNRESHPPCHRYSSDYSPLPSLHSTEESTRGFVLAGCLQPQHLSPGLSGVGSHRSPNTRHPPLAGASIQESRRREANSHFKSGFHGAVCNLTKAFNVKLLASAGARGGTTVGPPGSSKGAL